VCAFAYNTPVPILETNIRTVLFHHLYGLRTDVTDAELMHVSALLLDPKRSREWYYALMDYGAYLKSQRVQLNTKSKHYTKQKKFEGSDRQVRGALLRALTKLGPVDEQALITMTNETPTRVRTHLSALHKEGMVVHQADGRWTL
jgi:A/G-specific adenine glycosylase